jgi:hypothetical protein
MRTPPPALPPGEPSDRYKTTMFDRHGPDAGMRLRTAGYAAMMFVLTSAMWYLLATRRLGLTGLLATLFALICASLSSALVYRMALGVAGGAGAVARAYTMPRGSSTPYEEQFSYQEALAARGDVAAALESYEAVIAERPGAPAPRLKAAELYAGRGRDPRRAAALFREVRDLPEASPRDSLYAASRLVDLYDGPLNEPGRALVELRRLVELHPNTDMAAGARTAIARIKAQRALEQGES